MASFSTLVDRVKIVVQSSGTGPFELGPAVPAFRGVEALIDGATYSYATENGERFEAGTGVYDASLGILVRAPIISSNGGAAVSFPANVEISFTALAQDLDRYSLAEIESRVSSLEDYATDSAVIIESLASDSRVLTEKVIEHDEKFRHTYNNMTLAELTAVTSLPNGYTVYVTDNNPPTLLKRVTTGNRDPNGVINSGSDFWFNYGTPNDLLNTIAGVRALAPAQSNTIVILGDSRAVSYIDETTTRRRKKSTPTNAACAKAKQRYTMIDEFARSGERTDQYLAYLTDAIALKPGVIFFPSVYNDIAEFGTTPGAGYVAAYNNIVAAAKTAIAAGIKVVVGSEISSNFLDGTRQQQADNYNNSMAATAGILIPGMYFLDVRNVMCNLATNKLLPELSYDGVHLNGKGDIEYSGPLKNMFDGIMPIAAGYELDLNGRPACGGYSQLAPNPLFAVTTGGTAASGVTGTFAGSSFFTKSSGASLAVASAAQNVVLTCGFAAQGDNCTMGQTVPIGNWFPGDIVRGMALIKVTGPVNCAGVSMLLEARGDGVTTTWADMDVTATFDWAGTDDSYEMVLLTDEYTIPAYTTKESLVAKVTALAFGAGGVTVEVKQVGVLKKRGV